MNRQDKPPSLNYQAKGACLYDGILWDPTKQDLTKCPVCPHPSTMIMDKMQAIHTYNQGGQDAAMAKGSDGSVAAKSPKHGCFLLHSNMRRPSGRGELSRVYPASNE
jgi:hypothetical protein